MKSLMILSCLLAGALAKPSAVASPLLSALNVPVAHSSVSYTSSLPGQVISYSSPVAHPVAYSSVIPTSGLVSSQIVSSPVAYSALPTVVSSPVAYSAAAPLISHNVAAAPVAYSANVVNQGVIAHAAAAPAVSHSYQTSVVSAAAPAVTQQVAPAPIVAAAAPAALSANLVNQDATIVAAAAPVVPAAAPVAYSAAAVPVAYSAAPAVSHSYQTSVVSQSAPAVTHYAAAAPIVSAAAPAIAAAPLIASKSQYHSQDSLGQAAYGHSEPFQTHNAIQDAAGNKAGSFSYIAPNGQIIAANYVADALGYRVASNALPVGPVPVAETSEVIAARNAHFNAHLVANAQHQSRAKRQVLAYSSAPYVGYSVPTSVSSQQLSVVHPTPLVHHQPFAAAYHVY